MRRVVCAAMRSQDGQLILGPRHFDATMRVQMRQKSGYTEPFEQGFIDQHGAFLTRKEARMIAFEANQIIRRVGGDDKELFSENLY